MARVCAAIVLVMALVRAPVLGAQPLDRDVSAAFTNAKLGQASVGVSVIDVDSGQVLATLNERQAFMPASNHKLLTSGVALVVLGKDHQFATQYWWDAAAARLIIQGSGDPGFGDPALLDKMKITLDQFLDSVVGQLKGAQVSGVREVVVDDRAFDRLQVHASWPKDQLNRWYCAPVSGLNFHTNCLAIYAQRGPRAGAAPTWRTVPGAPWIEVVNKARTVDEGQTAIGAVRDGESNRYTLSGTVRATPDEPIDVTMHEPGLVLARLIADRVQGAAPAVVRRADDKEQWPAARVVARVVTDMPTALSRCNVDSQNLYAECLMKAVGHKVTGQPGSWSTGSTVMRMVINERLGVDAGALVVADGSGLSRDNRATPSLLANWLVYLARQPDLGPVFLASMAESSDGKLRERFKNDRLKNEVLAKTGYIRGVSCLSGYVVSPSSGRRVAFSVLVNNTEQGGGTAKAKDFHDAVVTLVDRWVTKQDAQQAQAPGAR